MIWFSSYLNGLVVFPTFFNISLNVSVRSSWSEPQSAPSLIFAVCIEFLHLGCKEYNQSDFGIDHLATFVCSHLLCCWKRVFAVTCLFFWQKSVSLFPATFCTLRPNLLITPVISWLPTFAFWFSIMKRTSLFGVSSKRSYKFS